jgi:hypothetical protein
LYEVILDTVRPPLDLLRTVAGVEDAQAFGDRAHVTADADAETLPERLRAALTPHGIVLRSVRAITPSLEDVFIERLAQEARTQ